MGSVLSGLSLLLALALVGLLIALSRSNARRIAGNGRRGAGPGQIGRNTPMAYAFSATFLAALYLVSGLIGYRLNRRDRFLAGTRWSEGVIWWEVGVGLAVACLAVYLWRKGLRGLRSNVYVPELAGHDASAPPSRRIERR